MTTIKLMATDQLLTAVEQPKVASGDVNSVLLQVEFDEMWDGYGMNAVFFTDKNKKPVGAVMNTVDFVGECIIPHEVLADEGTLFIGIYGYDYTADRDTVKTTTLVKYKIEAGAPKSEGVSVPPTASEYQQMIAILEETKAIAQGVRDEFDNGVVPALKDLHSNNGLKMWVGDDMAYYYAKDTLPENTLCIITNDTTKDDLLAAISDLRNQITELKGVELGTVPLQVDPFKFTYFVGVNYDSYGNVRQSVVFNITHCSYNKLELYASGQWKSEAEEFQYSLAFHWMSGGFGLGITCTDTEGNTTQGSFDKILGFKTN